MRCSAVTSASTYANVLYIASDGRTVVSMPKRRRIGCAQWCPARTAIPASFNALPTSSVVNPLKPKGSTPAFVRGGTDEPEPAHKTEAACCIRHQLVLIAVYVVDTDPLHVIDRRAEPYRVSDVSRPRLETRWRAGIGIKGVRLRQ
jgi:hypothetical protein